MIAFENKKVVIEELELVRFGKFKNYKIELTNGFNVIYGGNESGKSTVQLFIKAMLYGIPSRRKGAVSERDRAIPWGESSAEGVLRLKADGRRIEVRRRFGKTASGDKFEVCDAISGETIPQYTADGFGEALLGVPCDIFEKTMWVRQGDLFMGGKDEKIAARLSNLQTSGDESVSADAAVKVLESQRKQIKAADRRGNKGRLDILLERQDGCVRERYALSSQLAQTEETKNRIDVLKSELDKTENGLAQAEKDRKIRLEEERLLALRDRAKQAEDCNKRLSEIRESEEYIKSRNLTENDVADMREIEGELKRLNEEQHTDSAAGNQTFPDKMQKSSRRVSGFGVAVLAVGIIGAIAGIIISKLYISIISAVIIIIGAIISGVGIRTATECKNTVKKIEEENRINIEKNKVRQDRINSLSEKLNGLKNRFGVKDAAELARLYTTGLGLTERERGIDELLKNCLGGESLEDLILSAKTTETSSAGRSSDELDTIISSMQRRRTELVSEISALESKMAYDTKIKRIPADIDTEIATIKAEISKCNKSLDIIDEAIQGINEAAEIWRTNVTPQINDRVNRIIERLTRGRYEAVKVANDYAIRVETEGNLVGAEYLSYGTYDQLYFALRVAMAELICGGDLLFLDDAFVAFDDERIEEAVGFVSEYGIERQVILFTCQNSVKDAGGKLGGSLTELKI